MLRITREVGPRSETLLRLEGSIVAEWVGLLLRESFAVLRSAGELSLDLSDVHFVDLAGVEVLGRLSRAGVDMCCPSEPVASVLEAEGVRITREEHGVGDRRP
jgi:anti-anti-sigma regulatory factor